MISGRSTRRAEVRRSRRGFSGNLKIGGGARFLGFLAGSGSISFVACSCGAQGARSLGLAQRFVQALDFSAIEPLIPNLQPCAEGSRCSQILDGRNGAPRPLSRSVCSSRVYSLCALPGTVQQGRCSRRAACLCSNEGHTLRSSLSLATRSWGSLMFLMR
jgi:hypothetical protein